jgi:hypothetical protein
VKSLTFFDKKGKSSDMFLARVEGLGRSPSILGTTRAALAKMESSHMCFGSMGVGLWVAMYRECR